MATRKPPSPTTEEIVAALQALQPAEERGLAKHATSIITAVVLTLILWVGATLWGLNNTVTRMSANVDQLSKSIGDLQTGQSTSGKVLADLQSSQARTDAKTDAITADLNRVKERVRLLEGQKPLENQNDR